MSKSQSNTKRQERLMANFDGPQGHVTLRELDTQDKVVVSAVSTAHEMGMSLPDYLFYLRLQNSAQAHGEMALKALTLSEGQSASGTINHFPVTVTASDAPYLARVAFQMARNAAMLREVGFKPKGGLHEQWLRSIGQREAKRIDKRES